MSASFDGADLVLFFGSRSGSTCALALFGSLFAMLGAGVSRDWRRRGGAVGPATLLGLTLGLGPVALVYVSSLNGFYEARLSDSAVDLGYLAPLVVSRVPWAEVADAEARPAFRGRWRLHVRLTSSDHLISATSDRAVVEAAARELRAHLAARAAGS